MVLSKRLLALGVFGSLVLTPRFLSQCQQHASPNRDELVARFRAGQQDMQAGRFDQAVAHFKEVVRLQPDLAEARVDLGLAYHALGEYNLAVSQLGQAARQRVDLLPAHLFLGISYLKLGFPEKAVLPLARALALDPTNREATRALASAYLAEGDYRKAAVQFRVLSTKQPDRAEVWFTLGRDYLRMAKLLTTQMSLEFRDSAWAKRLAGDVLGERRLYNDAALAYRKAVLVDPAQAGIHSALGATLVRNGKLEEADSEFKAELFRDPSEPAALLGAAQVQLLRGHAQEALDPIARIWKSAPEILVQAAADFADVELRSALAQTMAADFGGDEQDAAREFLLSVLFRNAGDADRAREEYSRFQESGKRAVESNPKAGAPSRSACQNHQERLCAEFLRSQNSPRSEDLVRLGRALLALRQDEAASDAFAAALGQNKKSAEAMYWLSRSYLRLANTCFDELATAYPDSWRAHELQAEAFHLRQADKDSIAEYRAAERLHPEDPEIHEALGELLLEENLPEEAKSELETALHQNPAAARSLYLLGRLYVDQREPAKALPYLEAALRYDPTLLEARPVLGKAYLKVGKPELAVSQLERSIRIDRYGDLHFVLYQAYRDEGKAELAAKALARSQELRRKSAADDQAKIGTADE